MKKQKNSIGKVASRCGNEKFLIFLGILFLILSISQSAIAGTTDNVSGWAWSENVGWISFNSLNCDPDGNGISNGGPGCPTSGTSIANYGVKLDPSTRVFSGYAWSENIGWITFNESDLSGCPTGTCKAWLGPDNKVYGWARAYRAINPENQTLGGWDGWIKLQGANYGVTFNTSTNEFEGWAAGWDDTPEEAVIGWISFNCKNQNVCSTSTYKVFLMNQPPTASNPTTTPDYCAWGSSPLVAPGLAITLHWTYSDQDGDLPAGYEVWIDTDSNFHNDDPRFKLKVEGTKSTSYTINLSDNQSTRVDKLTYPLSWNTTYHWKVRVKDSAGNWSNWSTVDSFTTPSHAHPYVNFKWDPQRPIVNQEVQFTDLSKCYNSSDNIVLCSNWFWTFQNGNPVSSTKQNPTTTFSSVGPNLVTLKVTDSSGYWCENSKTVASTYPLPFWKEIPPFYYLEKFLASLFSKIRLF
jgi:hypothetical protein